MKVLLGETTLGPEHSDSTCATDEFTCEDDLDSDFQKDGAPPSWAPGYPKLWGSEYWKISTSSQPGEQVTTAGATPDEKFLAITFTNKICIFALDGHEPELVSLLEVEKGSQFASIEFAKSPNGGDDGYILVSDSVKVFPVVSGREEEIRIWYLDHEGKEKNSGAKDKVAVSGSIPTFVSSCFNTAGDTLLFTRLKHVPHTRIIALDVKTGKEKFVMEGHMQQIMSAGFSPNDKFVASTAWDGILKLYRGDTGELVRNYGPTGGQNWAVAFSADSNSIAVSRGGQVASTFVWSTEDPRSFPITLRGERGWQRVIRWSPDGKRVAIGAADGRLMVFNARAMTLEQVWQLAEMNGRWMREVTEVKWLEGGNKILFKPSDASIHMYDFELNRQWKWGPGDKDVWSPGAWFNTVVVMEKKGLFASKDQDGALRIWKIPRD
jgi:WD40 repeat protein